ncbi:hypothetical protein METP2_00792 [Methanosarcinales archaeon]|nr:hypothetical protein [Candidatus Methanoperedens sp.]CAG0961058.1 hypothetical protein METP2_00792 [Methanosarcinales archaeon]
MFDIYSLFSHGIEETIGIHVILSNLFWWTSLILVITAYKYRRNWNVGEMPWTYLFLTFLFFGIRELGHFSKLPVLDSIRHIFGIGSAIFMTAALILIYMKLYKRKIISKPMSFIPFIFALVFPILFIYLYFSGMENETIKNIFFNLENIMWITGGSITVYTTYMLGMKSTGDFVHVFMFFQFAAIFAVLWKSLGVIGTISCPIPYSIRELMETLFGVSAIISMYILEKMLRKLSRHIS